MSKVKEDNMEKESKIPLSKKGQEYNMTGGNYILFMEEDVKEKIRNAQRRLKDEFRNISAKCGNCGDNAGFTNYKDKICEKLNIIFEEEFGDKLI